MEQLEYQFLYVSMQVECWVNEVEKLSNIAETQPHASFIHRLSSKWNYLVRVTDWEENQIDHVLESLEKAIQSRFITRQHPPGKHTRIGLGLTNPLLEGGDSMTRSSRMHSNISMGDLTGY